MAVIAITPRDEQQYLDFKRHIRYMVDHCGSCEVTSLAFTTGANLNYVEMDAKEMFQHIGDCIVDNPRRVLLKGPRTEQEFIEQMAREMGCEVTRPITRPWNLLFRLIHEENQPK